MPRWVPSWGCDMDEMAVLESALALFSRGDVLGVVAATLIGVGWLIWRWRKR